MSEKKIKKPVNVNILTIQKSQPLLSLWQSELTLQEFKILDVYLSRIDSHNPDRRTVNFSKRDLEQILGVKRIDGAILESRLEHLMSSLVKISDSDEDKGFRLVTLFEEAVAEQDEYGIWRVKLECTQKAMKYFFNIENLGYLRYKLRCVISLTSRHTYLMFLYLENNRFRKSWEIDLNELKRNLGCDSIKTYEQFKNFNKLVLHKIHKELTEKTDCRYSYEPVRDGRMVTKIRFTVENNAELFQHDEPLQSPELPEELPNDLPIADTTQQPPQEFEYQNDTLEFLAEACGNEFDNKQMLVIFNIIATAKLEETGMGLDFDRYHFLSKKYSNMNYYSEKINILNRFSYFKRVIENSLRDNF